MAHRRALAMRGISPERWNGRDGVPGAAGLIRMALAARDDYEALATMANGAGGIYRFGPAMSSVELAALTSSPSPTRGLCRPCADWD
jgi:hypothetical protein